MDIADASQLTRQRNQDGPPDKKEIQWKLTLHQIGWLTCMDKFFYSLLVLWWLSKVHVHTPLIIHMKICTCEWFVISVMINSLGIKFIPGLDVARTDRTLVFYEKQENLSKLWDVLSIYAWFDSDVGYCQGESIIINSSDLFSFRFLYCILSFCIDKGV